MKKISFTASSSVLIKYIFKSLIVTVLSVSVLSLAVSELLYKLDLPTDSAGIITLIICIITACATAFISTSGFKNNGALLGAMAQLPLIIFIAFNLGFHKTDIIIFLVKIASVFVLGGVIGSLRVRKNNVFKV